MNNSFIITSEILKNFEENKSLKLIKKKQKNVNNYNYYLTPNLSIKLYNPKVLFVTNSYIVFEYKKHDILNLFNLLKHANEMIYKELSLFTRLDIKNVYNLYSIVDESLTIRCSLPQKNKKYLIESIDMYTNEKKQFNIPKKGICVNEVILDIRNVWETDDKIGFNLELKSIKN